MGGKYSTPFRIWSPEEDALLRELWADDTIKPLAVARIRLPHRSDAAIQLRASLLGFARERAERRGSRAGRPPLGCRKPPQDHGTPPLGCQPVSSSRAASSPAPIAEAKAESAPSPLGGQYARRPCAGSKIPAFLADEFRRWNP